MLILLTNDDGIQAPGLRALKEALGGLGELWVVAPAVEQSGVSHGFSLRGPLLVDEVKRNGDLFGYAVGGTPVDAVKVALQALLPKPPDLVVSGINRGENTGVDLLYSGTVAGAMEAAVMGFPAMAISQVGPDYDEFSAAADFARRICQQVVSNSLPPGVMLNVNVPPLSSSQIRGVKVTRQGSSHYEEYLERREETNGVKYYWTRWAKSLTEDSDGTDVKAVRDGYISVTPIHAQLTHSELLSVLEGWKLE